MVHREVARAAQQRLVHQRGLPGRAGLVLAAVLLALPLLAGCSASKPLPSLPQLSALPVSSVRYPSAELLVDGGHDSNNSFGPNSANLLRTWATSDSASDVFAYFDQKLVSMGWVRNDNAGSFSSSWSAMHCYTRGKRIYQVGVETAAAAGLALRKKPNLTPRSTVFQTSLY